MTKCAACGAQLAAGSASCWACKKPVASGPVGVYSSGASAAAAPALQPQRSSSPLPSPALQPASWAGSAVPSPAAPPAQVTIDARPVLRRSNQSVFSKAEQSRDQITAFIESELAARSIQALVLKSANFEHPCWVKLDCWIPVVPYSVTDRASAIIGIDTKAYFTYELEFTVILSGHGGEKKYDRIYRLSDTDLQNIVNYVSGNGSRPDFRNSRLRSQNWQFWKPENKLDCVDRDWLSVCASVILVVGLCTIPLAGLGFVVLVFWGVVIWFLSQRQVVVRSSGKPLFEPRNLLRVDSWQAVVSGAGPDCASILQQFMAGIAQPPSPGFRSRLEKIWYWGLDTKEEREQIVLTFGRGILFCQIYPYGRDLYVGWDAHLNRGTWVEKSVTQGMDRSTRRLTSIKTAIPGAQSVNEYDVSDLSCLIEWAHLRLEHILKSYLAQRQIDQEIDFKILRGDRQNLTRSGTETADKEPVGFVRRLRNLAAKP